MIGGLLMLEHVKKQPAMIVIATMSVLAMLFAMWAALTEEHTPAPHPYVLSTMGETLR